MELQPLYRQLAEHYLGAIKAGTLAQGERMTSVRSMMRQHDVSLSTALQACRQLESEGWIEARPRSGYFVQQPKRVAIPPLDEPDIEQPLDPAQYVGIHARVPEFIAQGRRHPPTVNLSGARAASDLYPSEQLKNAAILRSWCRRRRPAAMPIFGLCL
jgi:DNA-binding transcriptional MocR family regulator